jgi:hypothetical protein
MYWLMLVELNTPKGPSALAPALLQVTDWTLRLLTIHVP